PRRVRPGVDEAQDVPRLDVVGERLEAARVGEQLDALLRGQPEVMLALRAHLAVAEQALAVQERPARAALDPLHVIVAGGRRTGPGSGRGGRRLLGCGSARAALLAGCRLAGGHGTSWALSVLGARRPSGGRTRAVAAVGPRWPWPGRTAACCGTRCGS